MNGGGPTAQILEREGWKFEKDFVGHRKAVTCVRFNDNIFEKEIDGPGSKKAQFVCLAIGSRDRSMYVWLTSLKRPLFVIHDVFESSILDLSWSKDGLVLLACSMDGSVAAVVLDEKELGNEDILLSDFISKQNSFGQFYSTNIQSHAKMTRIYLILGTAMQKDSRNSLLKKIYGQNIGLVQNTKPIMIENPEFLKLTQNGDADDSSGDAETEKVTLNGGVKVTNNIAKRGPTDKQLEMMTSDGRRRITPIYILPTSDNSNMTNSQNGNSCESFGKFQMQSSSSESKSKIVIEKLTGIVEPNVSPGKKSASPVGDKPAMVNGNGTAPKVNMIAVKQKPGPVNAASNPAVNSSNKLVNGVSSGDSAKPPAPPVNMIQVKKAPGKSNPTPASSNTSQEKPAKKQEETAVKKKVNRIESSSSGSDSSDSDSSSSSSDDETTSQTSKSGGDNDKSKSKPLGAAPSSSKPGIMNNKRKADDTTLTSQQPAKKRGRPPGSVASSSGTATPIQTKSAPGPAPSPVTPSPAPSSPGGHLMHHPTPGLPPLALVNNRQGLYFSQHKVAGRTLNIYVHNEFQKTSLGSLHKVSAHKTASHESPVLWDLMLPAAVTAVLSSPHQLLLSCRDATLHLITAPGSRQLPPVVFPAPAHKLSTSACGTVMVCVTTTAKLFLWKLDTPIPKVVLKNEEIGPLNRINKRVSISISKIAFNEEKLPVMSLR